MPRQDFSQQSGNSQTFLNIRLFATVSQEDFSFSWSQNLLEYASAACLDAYSFGTPGPVIVPENSNHSAAPNVNEPEKKLGHQLTRS
jgi:hypothetical protein